MRVLKYVLLQWACLCLIHCQNKFDNISNQKISSINIKATNPFCGEWMYAFPFYSSKLTVNQNGTFKCFEQSCLGKRFTEGHWVRFDRDIILKSDEKYKEQVEPEIISLTLNEQERSKRKSTQKKFACFTSIKWPDTTQMYFEFKTLRLKGNKLIEMENRRETEVIYSNTKAITIINF